MFSASSEGHHSPILLATEEEALAITKASENQERRGGHPSPFFTHFPSAPNHIDGTLSSLHHYFSQQQQHVAPSDADFTRFVAPDQVVGSSPKSHVKAKGVVDVVVDPAVKSKKASPRKRMAGKKDRHSKIRTLQGLRDRRIRLSVQVSRRFFDLQDMLGFDKASKTIEWLLSKSRTSIKELPAGGNITKQRDRGGGDVKAAQLDQAEAAEHEQEQEGVTSSREEKMESCDAASERERARERMETRDINNPNASELSGGGDGFWAHQRAINNGDGAAQEYVQFAASEMEDSLSIINKFLGGDTTTAATSSAEMANYFPETGGLCPGAMRSTDLLAGIIQEFDNNSFIWPRTEP